VLQVCIMLCYWLNVLPFYASYIEPQKSCAFVAVFCLFVYRTSLFVNHEIENCKLQIFV
jgi:fumarate reductase subunit C